MSASLFAFLQMAEGGACFDFALQRPSRQFQGRWLSMDHDPTNSKTSPSYAANGCALLDDQKSFALQLSKEGAAADLTSAAATVLRVC